MAPRPTTGRTQKPPWYKTTAGQTIAAISVLVLLVVILVMVNNARQEAQEKERAQETLENYTEQIKALQTRISEPATEMAAVVTTPSEDLAADAKEWTTVFTAAQAETAQFFAPEEATASGQLFTQSINLFKAAAETLAVAADLEGEQQQQLISAASTEVQSAAGVWDAAVSVLDEARDEVDLGASGISSPISMTPPTEPSVETPDSSSATIPVTPPAGGGGGDGGGKNKKGDDS